MRKLIESALVTLDGVVDDTTPSSAPHAAAAKSGSPYWDEHGAYAHDLLFGLDALLLGRATYQVFAEAWPPGRVTSSTGSTPCPSTSPPGPSRSRWNGTRRCSKWTSPQWCPS
jgi:hypothetical protein